MRTFWIDIHVLRRLGLRKNGANLIPPKNQDLVSHRLDVNKGDSVLLQKVIYSIIFRDSFLWGR